MTVMGVQFIAAGFLAFLVAGFANASDTREGAGFLSSLTIGVKIMINLILVPLLISQLAVMSQRARDIGVSGWYITLTFAPLPTVVILFLLAQMTSILSYDSMAKVFSAVLLTSVLVSVGTNLWLIFYPGQKTENRFGPVPA